MKWIAVLAMSLALTGARCGQGGPEPGDFLTVKGTLTKEGVECPALRDTAGVLYTLAGPVGGFRPGDKVCVRGRRTEISTCQQGITLTVESIVPASRCP